MDRIQFMNIMIDNVTVQEAVDYARSCIENDQHIYVVTPNVDHIVKLQKDEKFLTAYQKAGLVAVDGTPIMLVARKYKTPLKEKITGPVLTEEIIKMAAEYGYSIFFLGAGEGVGEMAANNLLKKYPFRYVGYYSPPFGFEKDDTERKHIIDVVNQSKADIVIAGMGSPKTEIFLSEVCQELHCHVSLSVGAAIDFFAGTVKRCPKWINRIGMEWFYRFLKEPKRMFKRYFVDDIAFIGLIGKYKKRMWGKEVGTDRKKEN